MSRPITMFTGQWADLPLEIVAKKANEWGFDGLEIACWGDHFDVDKALENDGYSRAKRDLLDKYNLKCFAISNHMVSQCVCDDPIDNRHKFVLPAHIWGDGDAESIRQRAAEEVKKTAYAAKLFSVDTVVGFTGSSIWSKFYFFPPTSLQDIDAGYRDFADRWLPILDVYKKEGIRFALEVHPTEIAYDIYTARRALDSLNNHPHFGFNFDPSHFVHQFVEPVYFLQEFPDRIFHTHMKDTRLQLNGWNSILCSHLDFGDTRRGWDFVMAGRGDIKWEPIMRALNRIDYRGPLSIEYDDRVLDREWAVREALVFTRKIDLPLASTVFDDAFAAEK